MLERPVGGRDPCVYPQRDAAARDRYSPHQCRRGTGSVTSPGPIASMPGGVASETPGDQRPAIGMLTGTPLGIICGSGTVPYAVADAVVRRGRPIVLFPLRGWADASAVGAYSHHWV